MLQFGGVNLSKARRLEWSESKQIYKLFKSFAVAEDVLEDGRRGHECWHADRRQSNAIDDKWSGHVWSQSQSSRNVHRLQWSFVFSLPLRSIAPINNTTTTTKRTWAKDVRIEVVSQQHQVSGKVFKDVGSSINGKLMESDGSDLAVLSNGNPICLY